MHYYQAFSPIVENVQRYARFYLAALLLGMLGLLLFLSARREAHAAAPPLVALSGRPVAGVRPLAATPARPLAQQQGR